MKVKQAIEIRKAINKAMHFERVRDAIIIIGQSDMDVDTHKLFIHCSAMQDKALMDIDLLIGQYLKEEAKLKPVLCER